MKLTQIEKYKFLENMDRTNSKTKLLDILKISNKWKHEFETNHKYYLFI